jgi:hypothetical protein
VSSHFCLYRTYTAAIDQEGGYMHNFAYLFFIVGIVFMVLGILLFIKKGTAGNSSIKMFSFEFQLGGSSLVVFVIGFLILLVPVIYSDKPIFKDHDNTFSQESLLSNTKSNELEDSTKNTNNKIYFIANTGHRVSFFKGVFNTLAECQKICNADSGESCLEADNNTQLCSYSIGSGDKTALVSFLDCESCDKDRRFWAELIAPVLSPCNRMTFNYTLEQYKRYSKR